MRSRSFARFVLGVVPALVLFAIASCSSHNATFDSLANEGLIPVSTENPYLGGNLFLAQEMEASNYLYNFLRSRGAPQAIEVQGTSEKHAELHLYYSGKHEAYKATPQYDPQNRSKEWIVKGPYPLGRETYRALQQLHSEDGGVFEIFGKREVLGGSAKAAQVRVISPAFVPTPTPKPTPVKVRIRKTPAPASGPTLPFPGTPSNLDQEALVESLKRTLTTPNVPDATTPALKVGDKPAAAAPPPVNPTASK